MPDETRREATVGSGEPDRYLSRQEASDYLKARGLAIAASTLSKMVSTHEGPPVCRWGRKPLYRAEDLDRWIERRIRHEQG
jgi:hypothetical protein